MFPLVRWREESISQPYQLTVKVTIKGQKFEPLILCALRVSFAPGRIFIKLL